MNNKIIYIIYIVIIQLIIGNPYLGFCLPEGEGVVSGSATFDRSVPDTLTVNTPSDRLIVNYNTFNIGANEAVHFNQPSASSIALNRVLGAEPSGIFGALTATGRIFLINPNGVLFGPNSRADLPGIVASTLNLSNEDFLKNNFIFNKAPGANGYILNQGAIRASPGGYVALLSGAVENQGMIEAKLGAVVLASGEKMTLALDDLNQISVVIDEPVKAVILGLDGQKAAAAVKNIGTIDGGRLVLTAKMLNNIFDHAVNNTGIVQARALVKENGIVELIGAGAGADIVNTGALLAEEGTIDLRAEGAIKSLGILKADKLLESAASFFTGGLLDIGNALMDNTDGAVVFSTGRYNGTYTDTANIYIDNNAVITLSGDTNFTADSDNNGSGFFQMLNGSSIVGRNKDLAIAASESSIVRSITGVKKLTIDSGGVSQPSGALSADKMLLKGAGAFNLSQAANDVDTLAADINGPLTFTDADTLSIDDIGATDGITTGNSNLTLNTGGKLSLSKDINAGTGVVSFYAQNNGVHQKSAVIKAGKLLLKGSGDFLLSKNNDVDVLAADVTGGGVLSFKDTDDLTIGAVNSTSGIIAPGYEVTINSGSILDDADETNYISAATLTLEATNNIGASAAGAEIDTDADKLICSAGGDIYLEERDSAEFNTITAGGLADILARGVSLLKTITAGNDLTFRTTAGDININGAVKSLAGRVSLKADDGSIYAAGAGPHITTSGNLLLSAPKGTIGITGPIDVFVSGGDLILDIGGKSGASSGNLSGSISPVREPVFLPVSYSSPVYPPGDVYFNGNKLWPKAPTPEPEPEPEPEIEPPAPIVLPDTYATSVLSGGLSGRLLLSVPEQLGNYRINAFDYTLSAGLPGPVYFYHPLTEMDISAFEEYTLPKDAYTFINGAINVSGNDGDGILE